MQIITWIMEHKLLIFEGLIAFGFLAALIWGWKNLKEDERLLVGLMFTFAVNAVWFNDIPVLHRAFVCTYILLSVMYTEKELIAEWANHRHASGISGALGLGLIGTAIYGNRVGFGNLETITLLVGALILIVLAMIPMWKKIAPEKIPTPPSAGKF